MRLSSYTVYLDEDAYQAGEVKLYNDSHGTNLIIEMENNDD